MTSNNIIDIVSEEMFSITPALFRSIDKKLVKTALDNSKSGITPLHFEIMILLNEAGTLHTAEIGDRLNIARSQMTGLIDKLIEMKFVKRQTNKTDRRLTDIVLTRSAKLFLEKDAINIKSAIKESLSGLSMAELKEISVSLRKLRDIFAKLD